MENWTFYAIVSTILLQVFTMCSAAHEDCSWLIDTVPKDNFSKVASVIVPGGEYFLRIRVKCKDMIDSEMLRSLVLTGVNPLVRVESETFGINQHKSRSFSFLLSASLIEMGDQVNCGCVARNESFGSYSLETVQSMVIQGRMTSLSSLMEQCYCDRVQPSCSNSKAISMTETGTKCCQVIKNCSAFSELCNPAWVVPLSLPETVVTLHCEVVDSGIGPYIASRRFTIHLDGFHVYINNTVHNMLGGEVGQLPPFIFHPTPIYCLPNISPVCVIGSPQMSNTLIYTASEFEKMQFIEMQDEGAVESVCESKQSSLFLEVKGALSLPDRILINTGGGVYEVQANHKEFSNSMRSKPFVLRRCISHVVGPAQSAVHTAAALGFGEEQDQEKVFLAFSENGVSLNFLEVRDSKGQNVCKFLKTLLGHSEDSLCQVVTGSVSGVKTKSVVVLVTLQTSYHLVGFEGSADSGTWSPLFHFPVSLDSQEDEQGGWKRVESQLTDNNAGAGSLVLRGVSFSAVVCESLFLWGNTLLYSPDGGESIHWFTDFPGNSTITVFTSSPFDGTYAVLTDAQEVWVGQVGSARLQRLKSPMGLQQLVPGSNEQNNSTVVSIFFDSDNHLQQLVSDKDPDGETTCVSRVELPLASVISHLIFSQKREEKINASQIAKNNATSCLEGQDSEHKPLSIVERACPFVWVNFEAEQDVLYTRKCVYVFKPSIQVDSGLIQGSATLREYFTRVFQTVSWECTGISTEERQTAHNFLPKQIYLGRSEKYSFVFYLHLDVDVKIETSTHSWTLAHLQASLRLSDATALNVTSRRTELLPQKAVKYEVTVQDGGLILSQYRSGEGLTPTSLHIQVWNSALSCSYSHSESGALQGSYVMSVLLGCPAGRRLEFDPEASKNASGKQHFCSSVDGVPCFLFERDFFPVFNVMDLAKGTVSQFSGKYGLRIVGGGPTRQSIIDYTEKEQETYNFKTTSSMASLIWASKVKTLGDIPVFNKTTSGLSWLCGSRSPCAEVSPNFPGNAEYYFNVEFSNRIVDADSSNCDFTIQFLIRVHGLPPGSLNPSSVIVLSCIGILATLILSFFALKRKEAKLWGQFRSLCTTLWKLPLRGRERIRATMALRRHRRTAPPSGSIPMEDINQVAAETCWNSKTNVSVEIRRSSAADDQRDRNTNV